MNASQQNVKPLILIGTRLFQSGANITKPWSIETANKQAQRIRDTLRIMDVVTFQTGISFRFAVVINAGNEQYPEVLGEKLDKEGLTPTTRFLQEVFNESVDVLIETEWLNNMGSPKALNRLWQHGMDKYNAFGFMSINLDMQITQEHLVAVTDQLVHGDVCSGVSRHRMRQDDKAYPMLDVPQNTGCGWSIQFLEAMSGFNEALTSGCNNQQVYIPSLGTSVTRAGMEDLALIFAAVLLYGPSILTRVSVVGNEHPAKVQTIFDDKAKQQAFNIKIERQLAVMQSYCIELGIDFENFMRAFYRYRKLFE